MTFDASLYAERRARFMSAMEEGACALISAAPERIRSRDTHYRYRPDSDFYYLTGFNEPNALLLLRPGKASEQVVLFLQAKDEVREVWDGRRLGVDAAPARLGVETAYAIDELEVALSGFLKGTPTLYFALGADAAMDALVLKLLPRLGTRHVEPPSRMVNPQAILSEMRLKKDATEVHAMRQAAAITAEGYRAALASIRPGAYEYEVEAALEGTYRRLGADGSAYSPIVAGGENATILHYTHNNECLEDGELVLIDSGAEFGWYACDVSRTYPVNGRFTPAQKAIYELVLKAQQEAIAVLKPGYHVKSYHERAVEVLTEGLVALGLLNGGSKELIETEAYRRFYMHGTGHFLGLDTHDVGAYKAGVEWRPLEPGMVLTVEPGLYIAEGAEGVDPSYWGIGVRIEDDVLITDTGHEILTAAIPKTVADVEAALRGKTTASPAFSG